MDNEIKTIIKELLAEGKNENEILNILQKEKGINITYLELKLILAELGANVVSSSKKSLLEEKSKLQQQEQKDTSQLSGATITIDEIARAGTRLSGTATLSSGTKLKWFLDAFGRVGIEPEGGQEPSPEDIQEFQEALQKELQRRAGLL